MHRGRDLELRPHSHGRHAARSRQMQHAGLLSISFYGSDLGSEPFHLLVFRDLFFLFEVFRLMFCCCYLFLVVWGRKGVWIFAFVGILIGFLVCLWCCVFRSCWMGRAFRFWSFRTCVLAWRLDFFDMQVGFGSRSRIVVSDRSSNISCLEFFFFFHTVYLIFSCSCWFMFVWS